MSLLSMTGFGRGESRRNGCVITVEVSSVNRRQFDLQLHLPRPLQVMESRIQDEIAHAVTRGRVSVAVRVDRAARAATHRVRVDRSLAKAYVRAIRSASAHLGLRDALDNRMLQDIPDLLIAEHPEDDAKRIWPVLRVALRRAIDGLLRMRRREGRMLTADIVRRARRLALKLNRIERFAPGSVRLYRDSLMRRLNDAGVIVAGVEDRIAQEIALFAERADICEEIARLRSHLDQVLKLLRGRGPAGRTLDFLAQEMAREINTIGAKSCNGRIRSETVEFRAELERLREQVQNVE